MMTRDDFENSLMDPLGFWQTKTRDEVKELLGDDTARMVGFGQRNPHHYYDLFTHTLYTVLGIPVQASALVRTAAFFHDIGKPDTAKEKQGRLVFYGHAKKSAEIAAPLLEQMGYDKDECELICFYISHHDDFISWTLPAECDHKNHALVAITKRNVVRKIEKSMNESPVFQKRPASDIWMNLMALCYADASAQAELVYQKGVLVDSREHKLKKFELIQKQMELFFEEKNGEEERRLVFTGG